MSKLDRMFALYSMRQLVAVIVALISPDTDMVTIGNPGHLPPVVLGIGKDGEGILARAERAHPPLGAGAPTNRTATCLTCANAGRSGHRSDAVSRPPHNVREGAVRLCPKGMLLTTRVFNRIC